MPEDANEYFKKAFGNTISKGMAEMWRQRPQDPLAWLGQWLLDQDAIASGIQKPQLSPDEASAKISAGMKGLKTRKEIKKGNIDKYKDEERDEKLAKKKKAGVRIYLARVSVNCHGPWLVLKHAGIAHTVKDIDLMKGETRDPKYMEMNPNHSVPTIKDVDGTVVFESNAIMRYLCGVYPSAADLYPSDVELRARVDMALDWRQTTLYRVLSAIAYPVLGWSKDVAAAEALQAGSPSKLGEVLGVLFDKMLVPGPFICGAQPTIADAAIIPAFEVFKASGKHLPVEYKQKYEAYFTYCKTAFPHFESIRQGGGDGEFGIVQLGEVMNARQGGEMSADEAASKITAGMKGMYARRQIKKGNIGKFADPEADTKKAAKKAAKKAKGNGKTEKEAERGEAAAAEEAQPAEAEPAEAQPAEAEPAEAEPAAEQD